jgi:hypothetical protein
MPTNGLKGAEPPGGVIVPKQDTGKPLTMWEKAKPYVVPVAILAAGGFGAYLLYRVFFKKKKG